MSPKAFFSIIVVAGLCIAEAGCAADAQDPPAPPQDAVVTHEATATPFDPTTSLDESREQTEPFVARAGEWKHDIARPYFKAAPLREEQSEP